MELDKIEKEDMLVSKIIFSFFVGFLFGILSIILVNNFTF